MRRRDDDDDDDDGDDDDSDDQRRRYGCGRLGFIQIISVTTDLGDDEEHMNEQNKQAR